MARKSKEGGEGNDSSNGAGVSRRGFLKGAIATSAVATEFINAGGVEAVGQLAARCALNLADAYVSSRTVDTSGLDSHIEVAPGDAVVMLGNSNATNLAKADGKDLATTIADLAAAQGIPLDPYSGAVPGSDAAQIVAQYAGIRDAIPPESDQHIGVWAGENLGKDAASALFPALQQARQGNVTPGTIMDIIRGRGQAIDDMQRDLREGTNAVLDAAGGNAKSLREYGATPMDRLRELGQIVPGQAQEVTVPVAGETFAEQALRVLLKDWRYQVDSAAADVAREAKQERGIPAMFQDPAPDVHQKDFSKDSPDHFGDAARNRIARRTVDSMKPKGK